ncbi:HAMP domain-containing histidine kinase [Paenibacillus oenotherae]|uniref:histidine kinase n=1 Tax=Paenibacillus oenotherae TaxID=1435645 RepID=A0ABS7D1Y5_9BACL|nr:HAMP domain-containing sensor histidine kinase [Paenibacillus oenotherae]MBW7473954.1 HAMP domain-containing histidine kinase [Paenibacillus oenotherae]
MRTLRIRRFTVLGLLFIFSLPWIFFVAAHFMQTNTLSLGEDQPQDTKLKQQLTGMIQRIESGAGSWTDPNWQNQLQIQLREANMAAAIMDASNEEIYRFKPERSRAWSKSEQFSIIEDGRLLGRVVLYMPNSNSNAVSLIAAFAGLLLALFIAGAGMRRYMLKPLDTMSIAARQIAAGDWNVQLPSARITEIAEVRDGFNMMVQGLRLSHQKQAELEEERRFVIAAVAHDLRTPLFSLRGYLDGIEQGIAQSPEKLAKYVAVCKEKSAQLDLLVEELFTFTKIEYLEAELSASAINLRTILQKAIDSLKPLAGKKQISLIMNHAAEDFEIAGDAHLLERAMNNLLDNAVRHTPPNGRIEVQCCREDHKAVFTVMDTGPGFTVKELQRVFEPLYRGEVSRNRSTGGAGLGLTISRRIIRRHGGELIAANHSEQGALLSGWLPLAIC